MNNKIFFFSFMAIWALLIILNFIIPNKEFSEQENRPLAKLPYFTFEKLVDGKYVSQMDDYINDHFIFRNEFIKTKSFLEKSIGKDENNDVYIGKNGYLFEKKILSKADYDNIDNVINSVNNFVDKINSKVYFMLVPNSISIYSDKLPKNAVTYDQNEIIDYFYQMLDDKIVKIDTRESLYKNKSRYIYFKTDHHMTSLGALITYNEFRKSMGKDNLLEKDYTIKTVTNEFLGTLDSKAQVVNQEKDRIDIYENIYNTNLDSVYYDGKISNSLYNEEYLSKKDKYSYFLNSNNAKVIINTKNKNGKKLLVIKDSYAHIMAQFMCNDYEQIILLDPRYYKASISDYIKNNDFSEILFIYNVSNIITDISIRGLR